MPDSDRQEYPDLVPLPEPVWPHECYFPVLDDEGTPGDCECGTTFDEHENELDRRYTD